MTLKTERPRSTVTDQAAQCHETGHRIHPFLQPEVLDRNGHATDRGDHGADQSDSPLARRARRRHQDDQDGGEQGAACHAGSKP